MGKKILVVDDEEIICVGIKYILEGKGFQIETASSGEEAIEKLETNCDFDLVITDLMMGEKSGLDVLKKARELNLNLPVLVITAFVGSQLFDQAMKLDFCGYLLKPCSKDELYQKVLKCLEHKILR